MKGLTKDETLIQEQEANCFALFLLMPGNLFNACINMMPPINLLDDDDKGIQKLAEAFGVTKNMVIARLHLELKLRSDRSARP